MEKARLRAKRRLNSFPMSESQRDRERLINRNRFSILAELETDSAKNTEGPYREAYGLHPKYIKAQKNYRSDEELTDFFWMLDDVRDQCPYGKIPKFNKRLPIRKFIEEREPWYKADHSKTYVRTLQGFEGRIWPERCFIKYVQELRTCYYQIYGLIEHVNTYGLMSNKTTACIRRFAYGFVHNSIEKSKPTGPQTILSYRLRSKVFQFLRRTTV